MNLNLFLGKESGLSLIHEELERDVSQTPEGKEESRLGECREPARKGQPHAASPPSPFLLVYHLPPPPRQGQYWL